MESRTTREQAFNQLVLLTQILQMIEILEDQLKDMSFILGEDLYPRQQKGKRQLQHQQLKQNIWPCHE